MGECLEQQKQQQQTHTEIFCAKIMVNRSLEEGRFLFRSVGYSTFATSREEPGGHCCLSFIHQINSHQLASQSRLKYETHRARQTDGRTTNACQAGSKGGLGMVVLAPRSSRKREPPIIVGHQKATLCHKENGMIFLTVRQDMEISTR